MDDSFTVTGDGVDIWDTWDQFHYVYQPMPGECMITARVVSVENTDGWAKAGVMVRETLDGDARHAMLMMTPGNGATFQWRPETGGLMDHRTQDGLPAPYWVRIVCEGVTARGYHSPDGVNWTLQASVTVPPDPAYRPYVGLAVCSHNPGALCTAVFDNVSIEDVPQEECRLAAHWSLDEGQGTIAHDTSGNDLHGTLVGDPQWVESLPGLGQALDFDGIDDHVDCGNSPVFNMTEQMTAAAWVNITSLSGEWAGVVAKGNGLAWRLSTVGSEPRFHFAPTGCCPWVYVNGETSVGLGEWHHICGTYDGSMIRIYLDGEEDGSEPYGDGMSTSELPVYIGANPEVPEFRLHGLIDDVRIYNCALSPEEIADLVGPTAECFPMSHPDHSEWLAVGKPDCWCYPRQCYGDADDSKGGSAKAGYYYVGPTDLNLIVPAWLKKEPPHGPGIASIPNGICADFAHDQGGSSKSGHYRVGPTDLNILVANWLKKEPPFGTGVPPDCLDCPFEEVPGWRMPELAVTSLTVEPERANPGQSIALSATVSSVGNGKTGPATLIFTVDDTEIHHAPVAEMVAGEQVEVRTTWRSEDPGRHPVVAQLELGPTTFDWDPFNNSRRAIARISGEARPVLELELGEIDLDAMPLIPGQSYVIPVKFRNPGFAEISHVPVVFYIDGEQVSTGAIHNLSPGREQELSFTWSNVTRGEHAISVKMTLPDGFPDPVHQSVKGWNVIIPDATVLYSTAEKHKWSSVGPRILDNDWAGRISCFAYDPSNLSVMYAGSWGNTDDTAGGVWKTTNGGYDWSPVGDKLASMKVSCIAVDDKVPTNVYIGTHGHGIWKSIDAGQNWYPFASRLITAKDVTELIVRSASAPTSPRVLIYAATNQGVLRYTSDNPSAKISTAADWPNIKKGIVADLAVHPTVRSTVFATLWNDGHLYRTEKGITAKEETAAGVHDWTKTGNNLPVVTGYPGIKIDIYRSNPAYVYAGITSPKKGYNYGIYRSNDWGNNFQVMKEYTDKELPAIYNAFVRVHPNLVDMVYFGGINFWKWSKYNPPEGQTSWTYNVDLYWGADLKALEFPPSGPAPVYYLANDQGMWRYTVSSTPKKETMDSKNYGQSGDTGEARNNNLRVSQMYDFDVGTSIPPGILAGTQDTGNIMYKGSSTWAHLYTCGYGDGFSALIAPSNNDVLYVQYQFMDSTARSGNAGKDWKKIIANNGLPTDSKGNLLCNKYIIVHPHYPNTVLAACGSGDPAKGGEVYATTDAHLGDKCTWTARGPFGTNVKGDVNRIVIQPNTTHWYAGTGGGQIWSTWAKARGTWSLIDSHPDKAGVKSMAFSAKDPDVLYVLYSGGDEYRRVQRLEWTAQGGWNGTWIKDNLDLAKGPIVICGDAHRSDVAYVGTKHGVFCWDGARPTYDSWHSYNDGFPLTKVNDLKVGPDKRLYAATMGRGAWSVITGP
jgi:hypothetical protein